MHPEFILDKFIRILPKWNQNYYFLFLRVAFLPKLTQVNDRLSKRVSLTIVFLKLFQQSLMTFSKDLSISILIMKTVGPGSINPRFKRFFTAVFLELRQRSLMMYKRMSPFEAWDDYRKRGFSMNNLPSPGNVEN